MERNIKKWTREGEIRDDSDFIRIRSELEKLTAEEMRAEGYLPIHELSSRWSTTWLGKKYYFVLTIYGAYAGKKKAQEYDFWDQWRLVKGK